MKAENERLPEEIKRIADYCKLSLRVKEPIAERYEIQLNERIVLCNWLLEFAGRGEAAEQEQNKAGVDLETGKIGLSTSSAQDGTASNELRDDWREGLLSLGFYSGAEMVGAYKYQKQMHEGFKEIAKKLEEYAQHKPDCEKWVNEPFDVNTFFVSVADNSRPCTCGLSDLLGDKP